MEVIGTIELADEPVTLVARRISADGSIVPAPNRVQQESVLKVHVNDMPTFTIGCSASHLVELVVGRLLTEGIVAALDEIESVSVCEYSLDAHVRLPGREPVARDGYAEDVPTCCTNNKTLNNYFDKGEPLRPVCGWEVDPASVFAAARAFSEPSSQHEATHGLHAAYLVRGGEVLCGREDIGRHNAIDKVVGWALMNGVGLPGCLLATTGRMPTDMVRKAIRAGVGAMASKSAATDKAIELAQAYGLALVTNVCKDSFDIVT